jgi:hypothetical protein
MISVVDLYVNPYCNALISPLVVRPILCVQARLRVRYGKQIQIGVLLCFRVCEQFQQFDQLEICRKMLLPYGPTKVISARTSDCAWDRVASIDRTRSPDRTKRGSFESSKSRDRSEEDGLGDDDDEISSSFGERPSVIEPTTLKSGLLCIRPSIDGQYFASITSNAVYLWCSKVCC